MDLWVSKLQYFDGGRVLKVIWSGGSGDVAAMLGSTGQVPKVPINKSIKKFWPRGSLSVNMFLVLICLHVAHTCCREETDWSWKLTSGFVKDPWMQLHRKREGTKRNLIRSKRRHCRYNRGGPWMHLYTESGWTVMTNQTERERESQMKIRCWWTCYGKPTLDGMLVYRDQERRPRKATGVFGSLHVVEGGAPAPHLVFGPVGDRDGHLVEMPRRRRRRLLWGQPNRLALVGDICCWCPCICWSPIGGGDLCPEQGLRYTPFSFNYTQSTATNK